MGVLATEFGAIRVVMAVLINVQKTGTKVWLQVRGFRRGISVLVTQQGRDHVKPRHPGFQIEAHHSIVGVVTVQI